MILHWGRGNQWTGNPAELVQPSLFWLVKQLLTRPSAGNSAPSSFHWLVSSSGPTGSSDAFGQQRCSPASCVLPFLCPARSLGVQLLPWLASPACAFPCKHTHITTEENERRENTLVHLSDRSENQDKIVRATMLTGIKFKGQ